MSFLIIRLFSINIYYIYTLLLVHAFLVQVKIMDNLGSWFSWLFFCKTTLLFTTEPLGNGMR